MSFVDFRLKDIRQTKKVSERLKKNQVHRGASLLNRQKFSKSMEIEIMPGGDSTSLEPRLFTVG